MSFDQDFCSIVARANTRARCCDKNSRVHLGVDHCGKEGLMPSGTAPNLESVHYRSDLFDLHLFHSLHWHFNSLFVQLQCASHSGQREPHLDSQRSMPFRSIARACTHSSWYHANEIEPSVRRQRNVGVHYTELLVCSLVPQSTRII